MGFTTLYIYLSGYNLLFGGSLLGSGSLSGSFGCSGSSFGGSALALALTRGTGGTGRTSGTLSASGTRRTLGSNTTGTTRTTVIDYFEKKVIETTFVETGAFHLLFNFFAKRFHCTIHKRKIIFKHNDRDWSCSEHWHWTIV
jgi:hypothetical protein